MKRTGPSCTTFLLALWAHQPLDEVLTPQTSWTLFFVGHICPTISFVTIFTTHSSSERFLFSSTQIPSVWVLERHSVFRPATHHCVWISHVGFCAFSCPFLNCQLWQLCLLVVQKQLTTTLHTQRCRWGGHTQDSSQPFSSCGVPDVFRCDYANLCLTPWWFRGLSSFGSLARISLKTSLSTVLHVCLSLWLFPLCVFWSNLLSPRTCLRHLVSPFTARLGVRALGVLQMRTIALYAFDSLCNVLSGAASVWDSCIGSMSLR